MKRKEPILFDPERPLAHYERAGKLKAKVDGVFNRGKVISIAAFLIGTVCVIFNPAMMAAMALFGFLFALFSVVGCWFRFPIMCLASIPLGIVAACAAALSGSELAPLGAVAFLIAVAVQLMAIPSIADFYKLKELPGFPFFDPAMDDITFAAMDRFGSDEFIDTSEFHTEHRAKYVPVLEPSQNMDELDLSELPDPDTAIGQKNDSAEEPAEEKIVKVWDHEIKRKKDDVSDIDLFE